MKRRLKYIIVKSHHADGNEDPERVEVYSHVETSTGHSQEVKFDLPYEQTANMYYADMYPDPLKDEASCLRAAYKVANDPDGYEGLVFCRWTADAIGKAIKIDWEKFI